MADENTNNQNQIKEVLMLPGILVGLAILCSIFMLTTRIVPGIRDINNARNTYVENKAQYDDITSHIENLKASNIAAQNAATNSDGIDKEFFKPLEAGVDSESILASEFSEILELMKANTIKTRAVRYTYDEQTDDNFYKGSNGKFSVCQLDMEMIATYTNFKNFMKDLYKHEHYLDIAQVELVPYPKDKTILIARVRLKIYAEKV